MNIPRGFKIKNELKEVARVAAHTVGLRHRERRSFLLAELANVNKVFTILPGLIGPKFPQAAALASMARSELCHYFRQQDNEVRKDTTKVIVMDHYVSKDISYLLTELCRLSQIVKMYGDIVRKYYAEYLVIRDAKALDELESECSPLIRPLGEQVGLVLAAVTNNLTSIDPSHPDTCDLSSFRINCERLSMALSSKSVGQVAKNNCIGILQRRMQEAYQRSMYVDVLEQVIRDRFEPSEMWWFRSQLTDCFREALESSHKQSMHPLAFFNVLSSAILNVNADCPEEQSSIGYETTKLCDDFVLKLGALVETSFGDLWKELLNLENQILPIEAGKRVERSVKNKLASGAPVSTSEKHSSETPVLSPEEGVTSSMQIPGVESQPWESKSVLGLTLVRTKLVRIFTAAHKLGRFEVYDREYDLCTYLKRRVASVFDEKLQQALVGSNFVRPNGSLRRIIAASRAMQAVLVYIDAELQDILKKLLEVNFADPTLPPDTEYIPLDYPQGNSLIWKLAGTLITFVEAIGNKEKNLAWIPAQNLIARLRPNGVTDQFLTREDLQAMCHFIGQRGMRVIDFKLLRFIADKVR